MSNSGQCFRTETYPIEQFLSLSGVVKDYFKTAEKLNPFVSTFQNIEELEVNMLAKQKSFNNRELLVSVLQKQLSFLDLNELQQSNIAKLKENTTFCITTAHQTNLFGGPLYFVQKAISVIKACRLAKARYPNYNFVPIYWLGTEDHDFDELNHTKVNGKRLHWNDEQGGSFGRYSTESLQPLLAELGELLGNSDRATYLKSIFKKAYSEQKNIAKATMVLIQELLGEYGLLMIDGDDVELKQLMIPIFERELKENFSTNAAKTSIDFLENEYGKSQAHSRAINLFYLIEHSRKRIVAQPYGFSVVGTTLQFTEAKLLDELHKHPERFSPNVMLRPLMQEICLPNLLYVGGGGETSYWFQLKPIFDAANIPFPMLGLRDSAVYLSEKIDKKINQLAGCNVATFFSPKETVVQNLVRQTTEKTLDLANVRTLLNLAITEMHDKARAVDFTLSASAKAEEQRISNAITTLEKKMMRAEKKQHQTLLQRIDAIYSEIYPQGSLQERSQNFSQYYLRYGKAWIEWQLDHFNLFDKQVKVMIESSC